MEQQQHNQINKRINILIAIACAAMLIGIAGLVIGLMRPNASNSSSVGDSIQSGSSSQEIINEPTTGQDKEGILKRGSTSNN